MLWTASCSGRLGLPQFDLVSELLVQPSDSPPMLQCCNASCRYLVHTLPCLQTGSHCDSSTMLLPSVSRWQIVKAHDFLHAASMHHHVTMVCVCRHVGYVQCICCPL